ncbi:MAG TPA: hypothetical protein VLB44_27785, partial [Kofleriaceae bacterium]|nr:hypothetical protein [Kofleriaceae bacterium]
RENRQNGRRHHGIGSFEQQQWASERSRPPGRYSADRDEYRGDRARYASSDPQYRDDRYRDDRDDDDRTWFDRARDNVRGWFRHGDDHDDDRRRFDEEDRRRFEHMRDDDLRRFDRDRDREFSRDEQRWFDHPERSWSDGDEPVDDSRRQDRDDDRQHELGFNDYSRQRGWMGRDEGPEHSSFGGVRDTSRHGDIRVRAEMRRADRERYGNLPDDRYYRDGLYRDDRDDRHRFADTDEGPGRRLARDDRSRFAPRSYDPRYGRPTTRGNRLDNDQSNPERGDDNRASRTRGRDEDHDRGFIRRDEHRRRR